MLQISNNWCDKVFFCRALDPFIKKNVSYYWLQLPTFVLAVCSHCLTSMPAPTPSEMWWELRVCQAGVSGVLPVVVVCSSFPWPFSRRSSEMTFAKSKVAWAALYGALTEGRHSGRQRMLRMHYRGRHVHKLSSIQGCEVSVHVLQLSSKSSI